MEHGNPVKLFYIGVMLSVDQQDDIPDLHVKSPGGRILRKTPTARLSELMLRPEKLWKFLR